jgi:hypothetical protein
MDCQERRPSRSRVVLDGEPADEPLVLPGIADGGKGKQLQGGNGADGGQRGPRRGWGGRRVGARLGRRWLVEQSRERVRKREAVDLDSVS